MEIFLIIQQKPVSFIAGLTSLCLLMSCCTALSLCSSSWALPKPVHKPFLAELSICITGDSIWQKPQMPEAPEFWLPRGTPGTEEAGKKHHTWNFTVLSKWSVVILFNFYFRMVYSLKYFNFMQWLCTSNQCQNHWNFSFYEERTESWQVFSFGVVRMVPAVQTFS